MEILLPLPAIKQTQFKANLIVLSVLHDQHNLHIADQTVCY